MNPLIRIAWWDTSNNIYNKMHWLPQVEPALTQIEKWKNKYEILIHIVSFGLKKNTK